MKKKQKKTLIAGILIVGAIILIAFLGNTYFSVTVPRPTYSADTYEISNTNQGVTYELDFEFINEEGTRFEGFKIDGWVISNDLSENYNPESLPIWLNDLIEEGSFEGNLELQGVELFEIHHDDGHLIRQLTPKLELTSLLCERGQRTVTKPQAESYETTSLNCKIYAEINSEEQITERLDLQEISGGKITVFIPKQQTTNSLEKSSYYRFSNNQCNFIEIYDSERTINDFLTYTECSNKIQIDDSYSGQTDNSDTSTSSEQTDTSTTDTSDNLEIPKTNNSLLLIGLGILIIIGVVIFILVRRKR